jgi:hypothetical protein
MTNQGNNFNQGNHFRRRIRDKLLSYDFARYGTADLFMEARKFVKVIQKR